MLATVAIVIAFGLYTTGTSINTDHSSAQFDALSFTLRNVDADTPIIANNVYVWILSDIHGYDNAVQHYAAISPELKNVEVLLIVDHDLAADLANKRKQLGLDDRDGLKATSGEHLHWQTLAHIYDSSETVKDFGSVKIKISPGST